MHQYKIKIGAIIKSSGNIAYIIIVARQKTKLPINTKKNKKNNSNANFLFSKRHVINFTSFGLVILKYIKMLINKIRQVTKIIIIALWKKKLPQKSPHQQ